MLGFTLANRGGEEREGIISRGIIQPCTSGPVPTVFVLQEVGDDHVDNHVYGQRDQRVPLDERCNEGCGCRPEDNMRQKERKGLQRVVGSTRPSNFDQQKGKQRAMNQKVDNFGTGSLFGCNKLGL